MSKGNTLLVVIIIVALVGFGAWWYWSQGGTSSDTVSDDTASGGGTVSNGTVSSGVGIDSTIAGISASGDAEATQAKSEDGTEGVAQINNSLNNQTIYAQ